METLIVAPGALNEVIQGNWGEKAGQVGPSK